MDTIDSRAREILIAAWEESNKDAANLIRRGLVDEQGIDHDWVTIPLRAIAAALRESEEWRRDAESGEEWLSTFIDAAGVEYVPREHANRRLVALQSRIDALMLEYCPDEMTEEQRAEWARHQVPAIDAARKEEV